MLHKNLLFLFFSMHLSHLCQQQPLGAMQEGHGTEQPMPLLRAGTAHLFSGICCSQNLSRSSVLLNLYRLILAKHTCHVAKRAWHGLVPGRNVNGGDAAASYEGNAALGWERVCQGPSPGIWDLFGFQ